MADDQLILPIKLAVDEKASKKDITVAIQQLEAYYKTRPLKIPLIVTGEESAKKIPKVVKDTEVALLRRDQAQQKINASLQLEEKSIGNITKKLNALYRQQLLNLKTEPKGSTEYTKRAKEIDRLTKSQLQLANATKKSNSAFVTQGGIMTGLRQSMNAYVSLLGAFTFVKNIKDITAEFELQKVSLGAITQDLVFTEQIWAQIKASAIESPFAVKELVTFTKQIAAYGIANKDLFSTMQTLSDISAGLGVEMSRLILAYGQVSAATVLRGTELRQFTEAGIPLVDLLAKKYSQLNDTLVTTSQVFDMISNRQVAFGDVKEIFEEMTDEGGRYHDMQKIQAASLKGIYNNLDDALQISMDEIGRSQRGILAGTGELLMLIAQNLKVIVDVSGVLIATYGAYRLQVALTAKALTAEAKAARAVAIADAQANVAKTKSISLARLQAVASLKVATANNIVTKSFYRLWAALIANPWAIAVALIAGAVVMWNRYLNKLSDVELATARVVKLTQDVKDSFSAQGKAIDDVGDKVERYSILTRLLGQDFATMKEIHGELLENIKDESGLRDSANTAMDNADIAMKKLILTYPSLNKLIKEELTLEENLALVKAGFSQKVRNAILEEATARLALVDAALKQGVAIEDLQAKELKAILDPGVRGGSPFAYGFDLVVKGAELAKEAVDKLLSSEDENRVKGYNDERKQLVATIESNTKANDDAVKSTDGWRLAFTTAAGQAKLLEEAFSEATLAGQELPAASSEAVSIFKKNAEEIKQLTAGGFGEDRRAKALVDANDAITEALTRLNLAHLLDEKSTAKGISTWQTQINTLKAAEKAYEDLTKVMGKEAAADAVHKQFKVDFSDDDVLGRYEELLAKLEAAGVKEAVKFRITTDAKALAETEKLLKDSLDKIKKDISDFKVGSDFFENVLGLTGNAELAKSLTVAITGIDISGVNLRTTLAEQLSATFKGMEVQLSPDFKFDTASIESGTTSAAKIRAEIDRLFADGAETSHLESAFSAYVKFNEDIVKQSLKTLSEFGTAADKTAEIERQIARERANTAKLEGTISKEQLDNINKATDAKERQLLAQIEIDELLTNPAILDTLRNLDGAYDSVLQNTINRIDELRNEVGLSVDQIKLLEDAREKLVDEQEERRPFKTALAELREAQDGLLDAEQQLKAAQETGVSHVIETAETNAKNAADAVKRAWSDVFINLVDLAQVSQVFSAVTASLTAMGLAGDDITQELLDDIGGLLSGFEKLAEAHENPVSGLIGALEVLTSLFLIFDTRTRKANREIERQEVVIKDLEAAYENLGRTLENTFGKDTLLVMEKQLTSLQAQAGALQAQLDAENSKKGGKQDADFLRDTQSTLDEVQHQIENFNKEVQNAIVGTDQTAFVDDIVNAWLDGLLEIGDGFDALGGEFDEMVKNMLVSQVLSEVAHKILDPFFKELDELAKDGLTQSEIKQWISGIDNVKDELNAGLNAAVEGLEGVLGDIGADDSGLTGISKEVGSLSEDTALTLAANMNSQVYQLTGLNKTAAQILLLMQQTAGVSTGTVNPNTLTLPAMQAMSTNWMDVWREGNANTLRSANGIDSLNDKFDSIIGVKGQPKTKTLNVQL